MLMNTKKRYLFLLACLFLYVFCGQAIAQKTGSVQGRVLDEENNSPLPGANVVLKGTTKGAATALDGSFFIPNVPVGTQTLVLSYLGFTEKEVTVTVAAGQVTTTTFTLEASQALKEVVIEGSLEGQEKALNQQRTADNIKNVISADLIGRFPDLNVAEALQRVPGVNIERDRGEGGEVQLRGAPPSFTTVNINGEQIPGTQEGGQRNQELSIFPVDQLSSMEVIKAITPDLDGDNIGGTIDMISPTAKGLDWRGKVELGGGYNNIVQKANFIGRLSLNKRFFPNSKVEEGALGIVLGGSFFETNNGRDRVQYRYPSNFTPIRNPNGETTFDVLPGFYRLRDLNNLRQRTGFSSTVDYKFSSTSKIVFNYMYTRRFDSDEEPRAQYDFEQGDFDNPAWSFSEDGTLSNNETSLRRLNNPREFEVNTNTFSLNGDHKIGNVTIDYTAFLSDASNRSDDATVYDFRSSSFGADLVGFNTDFVNVVGLEVDTNDTFFVDLFRGVTQRVNTIEARNHSGKVNVSIPYQLGDKSSLLKFGGKVRRITNDRDREFQEFNFINDGSVNEGALFASVVSGFEDRQFFRDRVQFGPTLDPGLAQNFVDGVFANNPNLLVLDTENQLLQRPAWFYEAQEDVFAAYVMTKVNFSDKLMVLGGLRFEYTQLDNQTASLVTNSDGSFDLVDADTDVTYQFLLPNVHARYKIDEMTNVRAAFTTSFARPNFVDVMPRENINLVNQDIDLGNPDLRPTSAYNFDLMIEKYTENVGIISGGLFYKRLEGFIFNRVFGEERVVSIPDEITGVPAPTNLFFTVTQPQNGDFADLFGAEVNVQMKLIDFWESAPLFLKGIGIYANYTYTYSNANTFERQNVRLPGQADHTANFALSYDYKRFNARAMFNFNGGVIRSLGPDNAAIAGTSDLIPTGGAFDIFRDDRYQLDLSASYNLGKGFRVYTEFINVTNRPEIEYIGNRNRLSNVEYYDWWNRFGVSYSF